LPRNAGEGVVRFGGPHPVSLALLRRWALPTAVGAPMLASTTSPPPRRPLVLTLLLTALVLMILSLTPPSAHAEEVFTRQAAAANATDSTWIPEPPKRAALCIVDTGNDPNPDTTNVIARFSVDGGDPGDLSPDHHGTLMSMIASAPYNGWGMVGAAPTINVVSVRASRDGKTFGGTDLAMGLQICRNFRAAYNIKVVSLSLGSAALTDLDAGAMATVENMVTATRKAGLNVLAAAGNHPGPVDWPAGYGPVLAVGAADDSYSRCAFAASGPEVDLWAPGCPIDVAGPSGISAWAVGSSGSAAFAAAVATQLRQIDSEMTVDGVELALANRPVTDYGRHLDVAKAFTNAGLLAQLELGKAHAPAPLGVQGREQRPTPSDSSVTTVSASPSGTPSSHVVEKVPLSSAKAKLTKPKVRAVRLHRGVLSFRLVNRLKSSETVVEIVSRPNGSPFPRLRRIDGLTADRLRIRVWGMLKEVSISYRDPTQGRGASDRLRLRPKVT
jgi:Subtilase family